MGPVNTGVFRHSKELRPEHVNYGCAGRGAEEDLEQRKGALRELV